MTFRNDTPQQIEIHNQLHPEILDSRSYWLFVGIISVVYSIIGVFVCTSEHSTSYFLIIALFVALLIPLVIGISRKSFDCFEPIYIITFLYFIYYVLRAVFVLNTGPDVRIDFLHIIDTALLYVLIGFCALLAGYYSNLGRIICNSLPVPRVHISAKRMRLCVYLFWAISTLIFLYNIKTGVYAKWLAIQRASAAASQNFADYLAVFFGLLAYTLALIQYFGPKRNRFLSFFLWVVILPTQGFYIFLTGEKKNLVYLIIIFAMTYHYLKKRIKLRNLVIILLFVVFVIFPVFNAYRQTKFSGLSFDTFWRDLSYIKKQTASNLEAETSSLSEYMKDSFKKFMWRFPGIDAVSAIIMSMPERMDFQHGKTFLKFFIVPIPSFMLENKNQMLRQGEIFNSNFYGYWPHKDSVFMNIGEFYMNFKLPGIIIGMFFLGILVKTFYIYFRKCVLPMSILIYVFLWLAITNLENDLGIVFGNLLRQLIIIFIVLMFVNKGRLFAKKAYPQISADEAVL